MNSWLPDPARVEDLRTLSEELDKLRRRATIGSGLNVISLAEVTKRLGMPPTKRSTIHSYFTGKSLPSADILDAIVLALGATPQESREWGDAWFRAESGRRKHNRPGPRLMSGVAAFESLLARTSDGRPRATDLFAVSAHNVDLIHKVTTIAPDHEEEIHEPIAVVGGSGADTAAIASSLGLRVATAGCVGDDWRADVLRDGLRRADVEASLVLEAGQGTQSGHSQVFTDNERGRLIYVTPGSNSSFASSLRTGDHYTALLDQLERSRWIHLRRSLVTTRGGFRKPSPQLLNRTRYCR